MNGTAAERVTILTPVFNGARFVEETLDSVLSQGYSNLEYIVLDDGSTDDTLRILERYGDRIRVVSHANMGETRTVNKGFGLAQGALVAVVNADDPLRPRALAAHVEALQMNPAALLSYPDWEEIDARSRVLREVRLPQYDLHNMLGTFNVAMGPGVFIRKRALDMVGLRDTSFKYAGDLDLWFRLAMRGPFVHLPELLATHRVHAASASVSQRGSRMADEVGRVVDKCCADPGLPEDLRGKRHFIMAQGHFVASLYCSGNLLARLKHLRVSVVNAPGSFPLICGKYLLYLLLVRTPKPLRAALKRVLIRRRRVLS